MPSPGDRAHVHYTATIESTGELFDCSRAKGRPFSFKLGANEVISGWDFGVATMPAGRARAARRVGVDYAYGAAGMRGRVPPHATLRFDVELLSLDTSRRHRGGWPPATPRALSHGRRRLHERAGAGYDDFFALPAARRRCRRRGQRERAATFVCSASRGCGAARRRRSSTACLS